MSRIFSAEHQSLIGYWWIPSRPNEHLPGTLEIIPGRFIRLDLLGVFTHNNGHQIDLPMRVDRIFGIVDGNFITLETCSIRFGGFSSPGFFKSIAFADGALFGEHVPTDRFSEVVFEVNGLREWTRICGFEVNEADVKNRSTKLAYQQPPAIKFDLDDSSSLEVRFGTRGLPVFPGLRISVDLSLVQYFAISFDDPASMQAVHRYILRLWQFIQFCTGQNIKISNVKLTATDLVNNELKNRANCQLSYVPSGSSSQYDGLDSRKILLPFEHIYEDRLIFKRWFSISEELNSAFDLHFSTERQDDSYTEQEFIGRAASLEVAHRRTTSVCPAEEKAHANRLDDIYERVKDSPHLPWLKKKLEFSHEPTLEQRLLEMATVVAPFFTNQEFFSGAFIKKVVKTRNYLTHYSKGKPKQRLPIEDMPEAAFRLRALFVVYILVYLGLSKDLIGKLIKSPEGLEYQLNRMIG